jgi:chitinase
MLRRVAVLALCFVSLLGASLFAQHRVVGYYTNWSMYSQTRPLLVRDIPIGLVTDINYAFMRPDEQGNIQLSDPWSDVQCNTDWQCPSCRPFWGNLGMLVDLKQRARAAGKPIRTFFSVGGWGDYSRPFPTLAANPATRANFVRQAVALCETYQFDGVDIDWEYPSTEEEAANFLLLLEDVHTAFKAHSPELFVTVAAPAGYQNFEKVDWEVAGQYLDMVHLMTYDYAGAWDPITNHQAAIQPSGHGDPRFCTSSTVEHYLEWIPPEKLTVGIPFYWRTFSMATGGTVDAHLGSPHAGGQPPILQLRELLAAVRGGSAKLYWDSSALATSAYFPQQSIFATGADSRAIEATSRYLLDQKLGGAMIWELSGDTTDFSGLRQINKILNP